MATDNAATDGNHRVVSPEGMRDRLTELGAARVAFDALDEAAEAWHNQTSGSAS